MSTPKPSPKDQTPKKQKHPAGQERKAEPQKAPDAPKEKRPPAPLVVITPRLLERFRGEITDEMMKIFGYKNRMQVPKISKIVINAGLGEAAQDAKIMESAVSQISMIAGQKPVVTKAKKAIANFKIRKGSAVGCKVTLRRAIMYEFLDRLISVAIPRIRDFRGLSPDSFDAQGNYSFGLNELVIFPEVDVDKLVKVHGMDITITTTAKGRKESYELLRLFGMPFTKK